MGETDMPQEGTDQLVDDNGEATEDTEDTSAEQEPAVDDAIERQIADLRRENASWRTKLRKAEAELKRLRESAAADQESAIAAAREESRREAIAEAIALANERILRAEVIAAASRKLADPEDAVHLLDLSRFEVNERGEVDRKALAAAVDELVKAKPYLAASRDPDFGARPPVQAAGLSMDDFIRRAAGR